MSIGDMETGIESHYHGNMITSTFSALVVYIVELMNTTWCMLAPPLTPPPGPNSTCR